MSTVLPSQEASGDGLPESVPVILDNIFYAASENGFVVTEGVRMGEFHGHVGFWRV